VSSIRLFVLGSLDEHGPMHGHALRLLAEEEHIDLWTDITGGAIYGAIKRLDAEGLIEELRTERHGNYPERQVYRVTDAGQRALGELRRDGLTTVVMKPDPFDLALTRLDPATLDELEGIVAGRLQHHRDRMAQFVEHYEKVGKHLTAAERMSMLHQRMRKQTEVAWHEQLLSDLPGIIDDERHRKEPS
jgi:DNA-binding PadR family transcriptional regulator